MTILLTQDNQEAVAIPEWVVDLESFRRWAGSDEFPQSGWYSHLDGKLWVDASMETVWHNQLKAFITSVLLLLVDEQDIGMFFPDRMLLTHKAAGLSTEPDGTYVSHDPLQSGRARLERGQNSLEIIGTPDMVLEVVSTTSRQKDRVVLRELYHRAGIREYWIVEELAGQIMFELLVWEPQGYAAAPSQDGWTPSPVFGKSFQITVTQNRSGLSVYHVESR